MRSSTLLYFFLVIIGIFGALMYSPILFGLFTTGIFLILYDILKKRDKTSLTSQPSPLTPLTTSIASSTYACPNCGIALKTESSFCPRCGEKLETG